MAFVYKDSELPSGTICTERLQSMLQFSEYKRFIDKCKTYCANRGIDLSQYIDDVKFLRPYCTRIYFLPIDLAIGIVENVRMQNTHRGATLEYLYALKGSKIHIQLQERKAEEFTNLLQELLRSFGIDSVKEYVVTSATSWYRIDLYIPQYKLAIEYDENHHTLEKDLPREQFISQQLGCTFVRLKGSDSLATNLSKVLPLVLNTREP